MVDLVCKMNSRLLLSIIAIIVAIGFASNMLFVNSSFAESEARKAMKEMVKKQDEIKKAKIAAKKAEMKDFKLKILQAKLAKYLAIQAKGDSTSIQQKINDVMAKIAKLQNS